MNNDGNVQTKKEWLEADGLGGYASGTAAGIRTRRYHGLLLTATTPPTGRMLLVNGLEAWVDTPGGTFALSSQAYAPDVVHPDGARRIVAFETDPWPRWRYRLEDGTEIEQEIFVRYGAPITVLSWRLQSRQGDVRLSVRPLLSGRDYHATHHENPSLRFEAEGEDGRLVWRPYSGVPAVIALFNGDYAHQPDWYRNFRYAEEQARGLDFTEDLAAPGTLRWDLSRGEAVLILAAQDQERGSVLPDRPGEAIVTDLRAAERRRRRFPSRLHLAADAYLVRRGAGRTIVAGYPWFTDWGRDTFIALRGLCLATGRFEEAHGILLEWAGAVSEGMLPNRFPDRGEAPEFNSVDASLWYIVAVYDFLRAMAAIGRKVPPRDEKVLREAIEAILTGYMKGTRYGIRLDDDGLLAAGEPGVQLTWMDAKVGDWVVTPRIGKPVEVEALWLNALWIGSQFSERWKPMLERGRLAFESRFWNEASGYLHDVVDPDHHPGTADPTFRPNQIFAVGGLPLPLLEGDRARRVVEAVEARLWTPLGLRSLAPGEPGYTPRYEGGVRERDGAYHQGTVWPWLIGPFVEAWVRVRGGTPEAKREARSKFLDPVLRHLDEAGLGHISEIADGDPPHTPRGCPFQAWSVGEVLRLAEVVLAKERAKSAKGTANGSSPRPSRKKESNP
jgi:predicted glycogen debranching enzyme